MRGVKTRILSAVIFMLTVIGCEGEPSEKEQDTQSEGDDTGADVGISDDTGVKNDTGVAYETDDVNYSEGPLPEGNTGIARDYPGDEGIKDAPGVLFTENFEDVSEPTEFWGQWTNVFQVSQLQIVTEPDTVNGGERALEMLFPQTNSPMSNGLARRLEEAQDILFLRFYTMYDPEWDTEKNMSFHNGGSISPHYNVDGESTPGTPADGTNKYLVNYEATAWSGPTPGHLIAYVYHPEQRDDYGDIFYPTGEVMPNTSMPGNFGDNFVSRPNMAPPLGEWLCFEFMVKANTPGQRDGRIAMWLNGLLVADFPNMRFRDTDSLTIDYFSIGGYLVRNTIRANRLWYDDVIAASRYIGPRE